MLLARDVIVRIWIVRVESVETHNGETRYVLSPMGLCEEGGDDTDDKDAVIGTAVPGKKNPPKNWPDPGKKWKWDKSSGRYNKGDKWRHWHDDDGHNPHWDEENKKGDKHQNIYPDDPEYIVPIDPASLAKGIKWGTIGAGAYWIISGATRLFPPRNLVPIP